MLYQGAKTSIVEGIIPILMQYRKEGQLFVDAFCGGANVVWLMGGERWANDCNEVLLELFSYLQGKVQYNARTCSWEFPEDTFPAEVSREEYEYIRAHKDEYPKWFVAYVGFCCSFNAKFFEGYAGKKYQDRSRVAIFKQFTPLYHDGLRGVQFFSGSYDELDIPAGAMLYLDPPYINTAEYRKANGSVNCFDYDKFYEWCLTQHDRGCDVFLSEYTMPYTGQWETVWTQVKRNNMCINKGKAKYNVEKLFRCVGR